ncbi:MAG: hypothetical protein AAB606_05100 [Patescibacteria group bacterium]
MKNFNLTKAVVVFSLLTLLFTFGIRQVIFATTPNVTLFMATWVGFNSNDSPQFLPAITVTDVDGGNITSANGMSIMLPKDMDLLWDKSITEVTVDGTSTVTVTYDKTLKSLTVPVSKAFGVNESMTITGQKVRIYDRAYIYKDLQLDITGDGVGDITGVNGLRIDNANPATDFLPPYQVSALTTKIENGKIILSWENPPDPDYNGLIITSTLTRAGVVSAPKEIPLGRLDTQYTDNESLVGDSVQYSFRTKDNVSNLGEALATTVVVADTTPAASSEQPPTGSEGNNTTQQPTLTSQSVLDTVTQSEVDAALAKYSDLKPDTENLKGLVYLIKLGALAPRGTKMRPAKELKYADFAGIAGKAMNVELQQGSYLKTFKTLRYFSKTVKAGKKMTKKTAFKVLLTIKGMKVKDQTFVEYTKLRGFVTPTEIAVWLVQLADLK